jgi:hypothetical protein
MQDHITDEVPEPWGDKPPWELPGRFRLDCEPHRAALLGRLGWVAVIVGFAAFGGPLLVVCGPAALTLGVVICLMARHDLSRMRLGFMDPEGARKTEEAGGFGAMAVALAIGAVTLWGLFLLVSGYDGR